MSNPDEQRTSFIPPNFIEKGKILNGTFDIRNAIEAIIFALLIGMPVVHLPFSLTTRIIIPVSYTHLTLPTILRV